MARIIASLLSSDRGMVGVDRPMRSLDVWPTSQFSITNVRATHAALDPVTEAAAHKVYKSTIQFGGHPNERSVLAATIRTSEGFGAVFLTNNPVLIAAALKGAIEAAASP